MKWIDIKKDGWPTDCGDVAIWIDVDQGYWIQGFYEEESWFYESGNKINNVNRITHWCEITPPEKEHKTIIFE